MSSGPDTTCSKANISSGGNSRAEGVHIEHVGDTTVLPKQA